MSDLRLAENDIIMNVAKLCGILFLIFFVAGCSSGESKLQAILDRQIGRSKFVERTRLELDSILGKRDSKLKTSVLNFVADRVELNYTEIIIDGKRARVRVVASVPKMEEMSTLILLASFLPRETMLNMTIQDVFVEVAKKSRRPSSANENITNETYEFSIDFEKRKDWVANSGQLNRAFSKRNLITKR